jgi:hypothetical protein
MMPEYPLSRRGTNLDSFEAALSACNSFCDLIRLDGNRIKQMSLPDKIITST